MMKSRLFHFNSLVALILLAQTGCNQKSGRAMLVETDESTFKPGQVWSYKTRPGEEGSTLTILKVEKSDKLGIIVHIRIADVKVKSEKSADGYARDISHLPFSEEALRASVVAKVRDRAAMPAEQEGYLAWRDSFDQGKAGIFTTNVAEVIQGLEKGLGQ